jgi:hypothetical protein
MDDELAWIASVTGASAARRADRIQSLWSGYGELFRVALQGGPYATAVVKWAQPPELAADEASDARKRRSYEVETAFYRELSARCDDRCRVARFLGARSDGERWILVLEDLDAAGFGERRRRLDAAPLDACLAWLASFHARFLGERPESLWPTGTYWHLATRTGELAAIEDPAFREVAPVLDRALSRGVHRSLVHGDAKEANFCFRRGGRAVAAVDFQYVGGGCGIRDVAYLLHGRSDTPPDGSAPPHLDTYFHHLRRALGERDGVDADAVEEEWRALYPVARADFLRFLAGWAPSHAGGPMPRWIRELARRLDR